LKGLLRLPLPRVKGRALPKVDVDDPTLCPPGNELAAPKLLDVGLERPDADKAEVKPGA